MGKTSKFYLNSQADREKIAKYIKDADENDLRVLSGVALLAVEDGIQAVELEQLLSIDISDINASLKYWRGTGIVTLEAPVQQSGSSLQSISEHKGGVITHSGVEEYTNDELASVIERSVGRAFVDESQKALGKMLNKNEIAKLVGIVDQLGFPQEAVLAILSYCARLGKKSVSYAEKIAVSFHDEDIFDIEAVHTQIDYLERRNSAIEKVRGLFGFGGRSLSANEKKMFVTWSESWGFDFEIIKKAYEITVDTIHESAPKYTNAILKKWYENGLKTVEQIDLFIEGENAMAKAVTGKLEQRGAQTKQDRDVEAWFEERLRQSFGESK